MPIRGQVPKSQQNDQRQSDKHNQEEDDVQHLLNLDRLFITSPFIIRQINENEKLTGHRNYKSWRTMIE